ncbi:sun protein [Candidatus Koribacter versatilis Ellin345]|uniref:16S rRNA (cytosine(967)-C(5))-methyltransferase n=1 Tax=Koribacter versatilis (strain Ellin345) TaxID=204669 RepID=Q1IIS1_KORVE|nr:16S rRNA (cytosine(967)-C(5))-methyltransferase RsmB [Candidatus Koribacter versatilis]ABF43229.1 sun protein [Candidatus Koribacter versatilis Ellin345]
MSKNPSRATAFDILLRVERDQAFASELLHSDRLNDLSAPDRGLATELVMGTLRWQSTLDALVATQSSQPLRKLDIEVLIALRLAAYQLQFLDRIPANAAVNESVELVKRARKRSAVPFANAVLRKISKLPREIHGDLAHPAWLVARWRDNYGGDAAESISKYGQTTPETALRLPFDAEKRAKVEAELQENGVELAPGRLLNAARRLVSGDLSGTAAFQRGDVWIQDEASQLVALLTGHGDRILDCCAAPGGKTSVLAERNPSSKIVALELHEQRARLLRERVRASNVDVQTADATNFRAETAFDCVLADVPCSGTGTLARNPEIKWRLKPEDLADLQQRQIAILRAALSQLAPGGRLVYSTCSLEPEEGEAVVEASLTDEFELQPAAPELEQFAPAFAIPDPQTLVRGPYLRTIPGIHPCEGFFAAVITRRQ